MTQFKSKYWKFTISVITIILYRCPLVYLFKHDYLIFVRWEIFHTCSGWDNSFTIAFHEQAAYTSPWKSCFKGYLMCREHPSFVISFSTSMTSWPIVCFTSYLHSYLGQGHPIYVDFFENIFFKILSLFRRYYKNIYLTQKVYFHMQHAIQFIVHPCPNWHTIKDIEYVGLGLLWVEINIIMFWHRYPIFYHERSY